VSTFLCNLYINPHSDVSGLKRHLWFAQPTPFMAPPSPWEDTLHCRLRHFHGNNKKPLSRCSRCHYECHLPVSIVTSGYLLYLLHQGCRRIRETSGRLKQTLQNLRGMDDKSGIHQLREIHSLSGSHCTSYCLDDKMGRVFSTHGNEELWI
jgi:hypothetical protein